MTDVDVSLDFPVGVSSLIEIGNVPGIDEATEITGFGAVFSGEIDTSRSFITAAPKLGVSFKASVIDNNRHTYERVSFGAVFEAEYTYNQPAPDPQPGLPRGRDLMFHDYFGRPAMALGLLPAALGQRPNAEINYDIDTRIVRSQTHIEQRMPFYREPLRTYTFDYVIYPNHQFSIMHTMENCDRFPVIVPLFPEMYRFSKPVSAGDTTWWMTTEPEYNLYRAKFVMVFDAASKWGMMHEVDGLQWADTDEWSAGSMDVSPGAPVALTTGRYAIFPCMVGWVDSFEPETVNRRTLTGSLTIREAAGGEATCLD